MNTEEEKPNQPEGAEASPNLGKDTEAPVSPEPGTEAAKDSAASDTAVAAESTESAESDSSSTEASDKDSPAEEKAKESASKDQQQSPQEEVIDFGKIGNVCLKRGMTRIFTQDGEGIPVTVLAVKENVITGVRTGTESEDLVAVRVAWGKASRRQSKSEKGYYENVGVKPAQKSIEIKCRAKNLTPQARELKPGMPLPVNQFQEGDVVDVSGVSKGKGFAGTVKRHNFKMQDATHGNSLAHRAPGSIGQCQTPGRVWKGKKMAGHMGHENVTTQNLSVVRVDSSNNTIYVKGAVAGPTGGTVIVRPAVKSA